VLDYGLEYGKKSFSDFGRMFEGSFFEVRLSDEFFEKYPKIVAINIMPKTINDKVVGSSVIAESNPPYRLSLEE